MEKYFKVGQKVWDVRFGKGVVDRIEINIDYPIRVKFKNVQHGYKNNGFWGEIDNFPSLFQTAPIITPNVPIIEFEKGELVWVKDDDEWKVRVFSHQENCECLCFDFQNRDGNTCTWEQIRKFNDIPF